MSAAVLALFVVSPALAYLGGDIGLGVVSDADHLMLAELLPSLGAGASLSDWTIPLANYTIPDWPLSAMALLVGHSPTATIAWFMVFQASLFVAAVMALARSLRPGVPLLASLMAVAPTFLFAMSGVRPAAYLGSSFNHVGTLVLVIGAIALTIRWLGVDRDALLAASGGLAFVATFSDRIFAFWFLVPAAVAVVALASTRRLDRRRAWRWLVIHVAAAGVALPAAGIVFPERSPYSISLRAGIPIDGLRSYASSLVATAADAPVLTLVVIVSLVVLLAQLVRRRTLGGQPLSDDVSLFLGVLVVALVPSVSLATSLLGTGVGAHMRHYMVLFLLPLLLGPLLAALDLRPSAAAGVDPRLVDLWRANRLLSVALVAPIVLIGLRLPSTISGLSSTRSPVPVQCLEARSTGRPLAAVSPRTGTPARSRSSPTAGSTWPATVPISFPIGPTRTWPSSTIRSTTSPSPRPTSLAGSSPSTGSSRCPANRFARNGAVPTPSATGALVDFASTRSTAAATSWR